jgi:hypothetical protein
VDVQEALFIELFERGSKSASGGIELGLGSKTATFEPLIINLRVIVEVREGHCSNSQKASGTRAVAGKRTKLESQTQMISYPPHSAAAAGIPVALAFGGCLAMSVHEVSVLRMD